MSYLVVRGQLNPEWKFNDSTFPLLWLIALEVLAILYFDEFYTLPLAKERSDWTKFLFDTRSHEYWTGFMMNKAGHGLNMITLLSFKNVNHANNTNILEYIKWSFWSWLYALLPPIKATIEPLWIVLVYNLCYSHTIGSYHILYVHIWA